MLRNSCIIWKIVHRQFFFFRNACKMRVKKKFLPFLSMCYSAHLQLSSQILITKAEFGSGQFIHDPEYLSRCIEFIIREQIIVYMVRPLSKSLPHEIMNRKTARIFSMPVRGFFFQHKTKAHCGSTNGIARKEQKIQDTKHFSNKRYNYIYWEKRKKNWINKMWNTIAMLRYSNTTPARLSKYDN